jgi:hypothetical protein
MLVVAKDRKGIESKGDVDADSSSGTHTRYERKEKVKSRDMRSKGLKKASDIVQGKGKQ